VGAFADVSGNGVSVEGWPSALLRSQAPADYRDAASDPDADLETLFELARCPYPFVWQALVSHPSTPALAVLEE
jgi:hypothetical protein